MMRPLSLIPPVTSAEYRHDDCPVAGGIAGLITGLALGGLQAPPTPTAALAWMASMALGVANVMIINLAVSMIAFWTLDSQGPMLLYQFASTFLSGTLIPLWFMPEWLRSILSWLPFQAQMYAPLTIWFGTTHGSAILGVLGLQLLWIVLLWLLAKAIWRRAVRRVVILGG